MSDCFDHAADAYEDYCFGQSTELYERSQSFANTQSVGHTCKYCHMTDLHWHQQKDGRWRLCIKGEPHKCSYKFKQP
jgi:N-acetyl-beta-hexosaminidase